MAPEPQPITAIQANRWPDEVAGPWEIRTSWAWLAGRLECIGLAVWHGASPTPVGGSPLGGYLSLAATGARPVLASDIRAIPLAKILQRARAEIAQDLRASLVAHQHVRSMGETFATGPTHEATPDEVDEGIRYEQLLAQAIKSLGEPRPGVGRKRMLGPEELAKVAEVYLGAWARGEPPTKAVASAFGISTSAAAKRVAAARRAGLLAPTSSGRPSGVPELDEGAIEAER